MTEIKIINDNQVGTDYGQINFIGAWAKVEGFGDRFYGGDEHWTNKGVFGDELPSFTCRFVGAQVRLFGHKSFEGSIADVYIDDELVGEVDYYKPERVDSVMLFESQILENACHELKLVLTERKNEKAGSTYEASLDYIEVVAPYKEYFPDGLKFLRKDLFLEEGMTYKVEYLFLPNYANSFPKLIFSSSNKDIVSVDEEGNVLALKRGRATVSAKADDLVDSMELVVEDNKEDLTAFVGDDNVHTKQTDYYRVLEENYHKPKKDWQGTIFKADETSSKIVIYTKSKPVKNIRLDASDFYSEEGYLLSKDLIEMSFMSNVFAHDTKEEIPDVIYSSKPIDLDKDSLASIWVRIRSLAETKAGSYRGKISVISDNGRTDFDYLIEVLDIVFERDFQLELWMYPYSSNRYYSGKTTTEYFGAKTEDLRHIYLDDKYLPGLKSQVELYASAGGRAITATIVEDPWNSQTPDPYPSMIKWTEKEDGTFAFDYTDFDKWVELNLACGVDGQIKTYSISCWNNKITYLSKEGTAKVEVLETESERWKEVWTQFLRDYMRHTTKKGWFDLVYMSMDERPRKEIKANLDLVSSVKNEEGKSFKTSMAVFLFDSEDDFMKLDDLSFGYMMDPWKVKDYSIRRRQEGKLSTIYTCGPQASSLTNPPYEGLYSILCSYKRGTDGFLRWALDSFNVDPLRNTDHRLFASGDIYMIYPDEKDSKEAKAKSSHRYEKIREGIRYFSKIKQLKKIAKDREAEIDKILESTGSPLKEETERICKDIMDLARELLKKEVK